MTELPTTGENATASSLEEEIRATEQRLRTGEEVIRHHKETGGDHEVLARWENTWIKILRQYELLCDRLERQQAQRRVSDAPGANHDPTG